MNHEMDMHTAAFIINTKAGVSQKDTPPAVTVHAALAAEFPGVPTLPFDDVLSDPTMLRHYDLLTPLGGDGTITTIARLARRHTPDARIFTPFCATFGAIPVSLGLGRYISEPIGMYATRIIDLMKKGQFAPVDVRPGQISERAQQTSHPFLFAAGVGTPFWHYSQTTETDRGQKPRLVRWLGGLRSYMLHAREAKPFTVTYRGTEYETADAHVIKAPFTMVFPSPHIGSDILYLLPGRYTPSARTVMELAYLNMFGTHPLSDSLKIFALEPNEEVLFTLDDHPPSAHLDSQHHQINLPDKIVGTDTTAHPSRFLKVINY